MPYLLVSTILNTTEGHTANPSLILTVIKREMVLFYFKLISSLRRQHHFIQWGWMAHSAIAEKLPFAYLTTTPRLTGASHLKFSVPSLDLNWCVFHSGASSSSFRSQESQVVSLHHVNSYCSEGLCYLYSLSVRVWCPWLLLCESCYPIQTGHFVRAEMTLAEMTPSASFSSREHLLMGWFPQEGKPGSQGERFSLGSDCP